MLLLPTVLLRHDRQRDTHYDWLLADPRHPGGPLWTWRCAWPSWRWRDMASWPLTVLPPHRQRYLRYQGPLSGHRGSVTRVDQGSFIPLAWNEHHRLIDLRLGHCACQVTLWRTSPGLWFAAPRDASAGAAGRVWHPPHLAV